ncbi:hypothetical protein CBS147311_238 [Penicillium roqueforti]|nr:hypothetical protein CBS147311_238 [Penicillium roqueforti]
MDAVFLPLALGDRPTVAERNTSPPRSLRRRLNSDASSAADLWDCPLLSFQHAQHSHRETAHTWFDEID